MMTGAATRSPPRRLRPHILARTQVGGRFVDVNTAPTIGRLAVAKEDVAATSGYSYARRNGAVTAPVLQPSGHNYVEWHMRRALAPLLFDDHDPAAAEQQRTSIVAPARRSKAAVAKARRKRTDDDLPVHSFRTLLTDLGTLAANTMQVADSEATFTLQTQPTLLQQRCFELLGVTPRM